MLYFIHSNKNRISSELQTLEISPFIQQIQYHPDKYQIKVMLSEVQMVCFKFFKSFYLCYFNRVSMIFISSKFLMMLWRLFPSRKECLRHHSCHCNSILSLLVCLLEWLFILLLAETYEQVLQTRKYCKRHQAHEGERTLAKTQVVG